MYPTRSALITGRITTIAGIFAVLIGTFVLFGWQFDISLLKSVHPNLVSMKANTALGFILAGISLLLRNCKAKNPHHKLSYFADLFAVAVAMIGLITLIEYVCGIDFGIDQLLFREPLGTVDTLAPGRMAPSSTICFLLLGIIYMVKPKSERAFKLIQVMTFIVFVAAYISILGYIYKAPDVSGLGRWTIMAVHTALTFLALSMGTLCLWPLRGVVRLLSSDTVAGRMTRRLLPVAFLIPTIFGLLGLSGEYYGLYDSHFAVILATISNAVVISLFVVWSAKSIEKSDTDRKLIEIALRENESRLQCIYDNEPDCIEIIAADGTLIEMNRAGLVMIEAESLDQVAGRSIFSLILPAYRTAYMDLHERVIAGNAMQMTYEMTGLKGGRLVFETNAVPVEYCGKIVHLAVTRDVTERKEMEESLRKKEQELRLLAEAMPQIIWVCTPDGKNIYFNQLWVEYTGLTLEESYGHGWNKPFHPDDRQKAWDTWQNATKHLATYSLECRLRRSDGDYKWWLIRGVPAFDDQGSVLKWFGTCTDIEEIKQAEVQLLQAKTAAESANLVKSQFLANMSHEIRTPMNGIIAISQLLQMTELTEEQQEYADLLRTSSNNLLKLISDILDLSRIEVGSVELENEDFNLSVELQSLVQINSLIANGKGLGLELHLDPNIPPILTGDVVRLRQVLANLLGNAIKFTPEGSISLHVSRDAEDEHHATMRFRVRDNGIGIASDKIEKIFEPFTQAESSTAVTYGGVGLGLSIARHIVELMGGSIGVESLEGQGSTFWFTAVLRKQVHASGATILEEKAAVDSASYSLRILLVEDDEANQVAFGRLLTKTNHQVELVENGLEALKKLEENDYDVVLMDCRMPLMDGYEATAAIRDPGSRVRNHAIPIIALTANAMREDRKRCLDAGMNDYLSKPIEFTALETLLEKWGKQQ